MCLVLVTLHVMCGHVLMSAGGLTNAVVTVQTAAGVI